MPVCNNHTFKVRLLENSVVDFIIIFIFQKKKNYLYLNIFFFFLCEPNIHITIKIIQVIIQSGYFETGKVMMKNKIKLVLPFGNFKLIIIVIIITIVKLFMKIIYDMIISIKIKQQVFCYDEHVYRGLDFTYTFERIVHTRINILLTCAFHNQPNVNDNI